MTAPDGPKPVATSAAVPTPGDVVPSVAEFEALRALVRALLRAQEMERDRVAHDLHERVAQALTALRLGLAASPIDGAGRERLRALAADVLRDVRRLALELRPAALDTLGLEAALRSCARELAERGGPPVEVCVALPARVPPADATLLYRVAQEALTNVVRHAHATRASVVVVGRDDAIDLVVEDDGAGFDPQRLAPEARTGLTAMRERVVDAGGRWSLETAPGSGCRVHARLPVR
jgi:signal transduction histidine kinase